jgi:hypothetical protein
MLVGLRNTRLRDAVITNRAFDAYLFLILQPLLDAFTRFVREVLRLSLSKLLWVFLRDVT